MISRLQGVAVEQELDGTCVLDVGGVGYEVFVPQRTRLPAPPEETTLFIHTHVREDAFTLYGFVTREDRAAFRALLGVSSIGPRLALAVLSVLDAHELALAVGRADKARFKGIPGVGKKIVDRLVLELKDKLPATLMAAQPTARTGVAPVATQLPQRERVVDALVQLGYRRGEAEAAAGKLPDESLNAPVEDLLRQALSFLG